MNKAVFLDRDGTINKDIGYLHRIEDFEYLDGAVENIKALQKMGYLLIIVTNQSGIARGFFSEEEYLKLQKWMIDDLKQKGVTITACYYCPHHPDAIIPKYRCICGCRKPGTDLFYRAAREHNIDLDKSLVIGDKSRDLCICKETSAKGILLTDGWKNFSL